MCQYINILLILLIIILLTHSALYYKNTKQVSYLENIKQMIKKNIPNIISASRIPLGIIFLLLIKSSVIHIIIAFVVIIISILTDYLDGYLARKQKLISKFGKWLDPVTDFIFFLFVYIGFLNTGIMPYFLFFIFLLREIIIYSIIRPLYVALKIEVSAKYPGKIKTVLQGIGSLIIVLGLVLEKLNILSHDLFIYFSFLMLVLMVSFSLLSLYWYIKEIVKSIKTNDKLTNHMLKTASLLMFLQLIFITVSAYIFSTSFVNMSIFLLICIAFHGSILFGMLKLQHLFVFENNNISMKKINISNILSLFRLSSGPTLLFLYLSANVSSFTIVIVIIFTAIVFITDLLDGLLARILNQLTKIGKYLDASSDYMILFLVAMFFLVNNIIPLWFFILLLLRFLIVFIGNTFSLAKYKNIAHLTSFLGKASVFSLMVLFGLKIFVLFINLRGELLLDTKIIFFNEESVIHAVDKVEYMVTGVLIITIVEKTMLIIKNYKEKKKELY